MFLSQYLPLYDGEIFFFVFLAGHEVLADMRFWPRKLTISFLSNLRSPRGPIRYALSMPRLLHRLTVLIWTLSVLATSLAVRNLSSSLTSTMHYFPLRRHIGVLGIWLMFFGILILTLPLFTVLPTGYNIALLEPISPSSEQSLTSPDGTNETTPIAPMEEASPSDAQAVDISTAVNTPTPSDQVLTSHQEPVINMPADDEIAPGKAISSPGDKVAATLLPSVKVGTDIGNLAPDFTLKTINGKAITLSDLHGKKVLLNFWSTRCGACIVGFPLIRETYVKHGKNSGDIAVITVCIDARVDRIKAIENKYGDKYGPLDFPILLDEQTKAKNDYHIWAVPTTFFIDSQGIIKQMKPGRFQAQQEIEDILKSLQ